VARQDIQKQACAQVREQWLATLEALETNTEPHASHGSIDLKQKMVMQEKNT
jgi:hypothetical protein